MSSDLHYKIDRLDYRAGREPEFTEDEHFVAEHMLQLDFEMLNDDGTVFGCTLSQVLVLLRARGGAVSRVKDHEIAIHVNILTEVAREFGQSQQLRERILELVRKWSRPPSGLQ